MPNFLHCYDDFADLLTAFHRQIVTGLIMRQLRNQVVGEHFKLCTGPNTSGFPHIGSQFTQIIIIIRRWRGVTIATEE